MENNSLENTAQGKTRASLTPFLIIGGVLLLLAAGIVGWRILSTPDMRFGGATGPTGDVTPQGPDFVLTGDTGGTVTSIRNEGRFPVTISLPGNESEDGYRIHVGLSPTEDGYVIPAGSDRKLTPEQVQAPFQSITMEPGDLAWVSSTVWYPSDCRALKGDNPEEITGESAWIGPSSVTLVGETLGRSSTFSVQIPQLVIPLNSESGQFAQCGTFEVK